VIFLNRSAVKIEGSTLNFYGFAKQYSGSILEKSKVRGIFLSSCRSAFRPARA
jgi:hypothetical protein